MRETGGSSEACFHDWQLMVTLTEQFSTSTGLIRKTKRVRLLRWVAGCGGGLTIRTQCTKTALGLPHTEKHKAAQFGCGVFSPKVSSLLQCSMKERS